MGSVFDKGPYIMGVVNVTPDSFSDGGQFFSSDAAIEHGIKLAEDGADILDIGGESTRPGAAPVSPQQEIDRVIPVIEGLQNCGKRISIDTRNAQTMQAALKAGAGMVNDVTSLQGDPESMNIVAQSDVPVCLMHMQGGPQTMQQEPHYDDVVADVVTFLAERIESCENAGISKDRTAVDPGIGFGKTLEHNLLLLKNLEQFHALGVTMVLGVSRKSFIEKICPGTPATDRLPGSLAAALWGLQKGVTILRVHDVAETKQAIDIYQAISKS